MHAILADWPEDRPTLEYTLEAAERPLIAASEALLAELERSGGSGPPPT